MRPCECGQVSGDMCESREPTATVVEYMPPYLRASHTAAGNGGVYPHNGAVRLHVTEACAKWILESNRDWATVV